MENVAYLCWWNLNKMGFVVLKKLKINLIHRLYFFATLRLCSYKLRKENRWAKSNTKINLINQ